MRLHILHEACNCIYSKLLYIFIWNHGNRIYCELRSPHIILISCDYEIIQWFQCDYIYRKCCAVSYNVFWGSLSVGFRQQQKCNCVCKTWWCRIVKIGFALLGMSLCLQIEIRHISCCQWPCNNSRKSSWGCSLHPQHGARGTGSSCRCVWRPSRSRCTWFQRLVEVCCRLGVEPAGRRYLERPVGSAAKFSTSVSYKHTVYGGPSSLIFNNNTQYKNSDYLNNTFYKCYKLTGVVNKIFIQYLNQMHLSWY